MATLTLAGITGLDIADEDGCLELNFTQYGRTALCLYVKPEAQADLLQILKRLHSQSETVGVEVSQRLDAERIEEWFGFRRSFEVRRKERVAGDETAPHEDTSIAGDGDRVLQEAEVG